MRPELAGIDLWIIVLYLLFACGVGAFFARRAGSSVESFFVGSRKLPWWLAGTSIVATTFAADTPLAVTGIVAADGISGNWIWWCYAIAHLTVTFFFARMWRRSGVITDAEIVEIRYGGRPAAALRAFKAVYFGLFLNCLTMAWVIAAMVKISRAFFDFEPGWVIAGALAVSVIYTTLGGFRSVVVTDLVQFTLGMGGAILLAVLLVSRMGGVGSIPVEGEGGTGLLGQVAEAVKETGERTIGEVLDFVPSADHPSLPLAYFTALLLAGWWRHAEGYGYIVQRLAACRDEGQAQGASLWFTIAQNALRPWPWILVGLASLVLYPELPRHPGAGVDKLSALVESRAPMPLAVEVEPTYLDVASGGELRFRGLPEEGCFAEMAGQRVALAARLNGGGGEGSGVARFGTFAATGAHELRVDCGEEVRTASLGVISVELQDREMAYPLLMGQALPAGLLGLAVASLLAAFMSTIDTHTNWGASYLVRDIYQRFIRPDAEPGHYVWVSRGAILLMALLAGVSALFVHSIASVWRFLIALGAGLGSVTVARWYWPRVTPHAEFAAMGVTTVLAIALEVFGTATLFGGENRFFVTAVDPATKIFLIAGISLATWIPVALFGPQNKPEVLLRFARKVRPPGPGWAIYRESAGDPLGPMFTGFAAGAVSVFGFLFGAGDLLLGRPLRGAFLLAAAVTALLWIVRRGRREPAGRSSPTP